jgi:CRISPR-associated protein Cmr1
MQTLVARYRVTAPLFMGTPAGPSKLGLNLGGVKAAVRFWWRALNYAKLGRDVNALRVAEARLFGAAADQSAAAGRSRFLWRLQWANGEPTKREAGRDQLLPGASNLRGLVYLAGQGLMEVGRNETRRLADGTQEIIRRVPWGELKRPCYWDDQPSLLEIRLLAPDGALHNGQQWTPDGESFVDALQLLGLLGGIGSRKSRGFGSLSLAYVVLEHSDETSVAGPETREGYESAVVALLSKYPAALVTDLPDFPSFWKRSVVWLLAGPGSTDIESSKYRTTPPFQVANDPLSLLNHIGRQMVRYRSFGRAAGRGRQTTLDEHAEQNFADDHDWAKHPETGLHAAHHARRIAFGMPQGYTGCEVAWVKPSGNERRGSPLLIHLHRLGNGEHMALATMLPARLVPDGAGLEIVIGRGRDARGLSRPLMPGFEQTGAWEVLTEFINGRIGRSGAKTGPDYFVGRRQIWP